MSVNSMVVVDQPILAFFGLPGGMEWVIILVVALLIFGRKLPDVARSVGRSIVEFKKGIRDVKDDIDVQASVNASPTPKLDSPPKETTSAPPAQPPSSDEANKSTSNEA